MRSNYMHTLFTRCIDPSIPAPVCKNVNHRIDNPTAQDKFIENSLAPHINPLVSRSQKKSRGLITPFGPRPYGHRVYNHSWYKAATIGAAEGGLPGMKAAILHNVGDMVRDQFVQAMGSRNADLAESIFQWVLEGKKRR